MLRTWRAVRSVVVLVLATWLSVEALAGAHLYTIQGDMCEGLRSRVENQQPLPKSPTLSTCVQRHPAVYRAFLLEFGVALASAAVGVRWLIQALRTGTSRQ